MQIQTPVVSSLDLRDDQTSYPEIFTLVVEISVKVYYFGTSFFASLQLYFFNHEIHEAHEIFVELFF